MSSATAPAGLAGLVQAGPAQAGPIRTCVVCRTRAAQTGLVRMVQVDGDVILSRVAPGRGAWVHPACVARLSVKTVSRALRAPVGWPINPGTQG